MLFLSIMKYSKDGSTLPVVLCKKYVTVHAYVSSNGICRGFAFQYGKFLLPPRFLTALLKLPGIDFLF